MASHNEFRLELSQTAEVRPGVFRARISIIYAGMLNDNTFVLAVLWSFGHNSMAYNLYLPKDCNKVYIPKGYLEIIAISRQEIQFRYIEEPSFVQPVK